MQFLEKLKGKDSQNLLHKTILLKIIIANIFFLLFTAKPATTTCVTNLSVDGVFEVYGKPCPVQSGDQFCGFVHNDSSADKCEIFTWCGVFYDVADERNFDVAYFRFVFYSKAYIGAKNCATKTGSSGR